MQNLQNEIQNKFTTLNWPTVSDEKWMRSDPEGIPFNLLTDTVGDTEKQVNKVIDEQVSSQIAVLASSLGNENITYSQVTKENIGEASFEGLRNLLAQSLVNSDEKVDAWRLSRSLQNNSYVGYIHVAKNTVCEKPVQITIRTQNSPEDVIAPQIVVILEEGAKFNLSLSLEGDGFFLPAFYGYAQDKSNLHYHLLQNTSMDSITISSSFFKADTQAQMQSTSGQLGGMISVDNVYSIAEGENSNLLLNGFYFAIEDQLFDLRAYQSHIAEDTDSRALYHGVAVGEAHTIFRGMIAVGHDAINTDAYLTNNNLLLSEYARMDSIPCLNINTNEVRCSHGSTTGNIDETHLFYLMSRGFSKQEAKHLLVEGFFEKTFDSHFEEENEKALEIIRKRTQYI